MPLDQAWLAVFRACGSLPARVRAPGQAGPETNRFSAGERLTLLPLRSFFVSPGRRVNSPPPRPRSRCALRRFAAICLSLLAAGCATPADRIAARAGLERVELTDLPLPLVAYRRTCAAGATMNVYLEHDGQP